MLGGGTIYEKLEVPGVFVKLIQRFDVQLFVGDFQFFVDQPGSCGTLPGVLAKQFGNQSSAQQFS